MNLKDPKDVGLVVLIGAGIVLLTPIVGSFVGGISLMQTPLIGAFNLGALVGAGVTAVGLTYVVDKFLK